MTDADLKTPKDILISEPHPRMERESFLGGRYRVLSRSGLSRGDRLMLEVFENLAAPRVLDILESWTGVPGMIAHDLFPEADITFHCLDLFHARRLETNLSRNEMVVPVRCEPYLERRDEADLVFLRIGRQDMSRELGFDLLQQAHLALKKGGKCFIAQEGKDPQIQQHAAALFGGVTLIMQSEGDRLLVGKKRGPLEEITSYAAEFELTVQGKEPVTLSTVPGVFSHRQVDAGALALAEVVESQPGDSVIDMGCGSGAIGISLARNQELTRICFVDSNSRATLLTEKNCLRNGIENAEVVLSDKGPEGDGEFTLFVGNPPYYSNFRIAELFVRTAHRALKPGGRAYIVAKTAEWHRDFMKQIFGNAEVLNRRGYEIVKSVKSQEK